MIQTLEIKNFKSIKQLNLECKRINVFIGKPNTGKSNILEALGIFSYGAFFRDCTLSNFIRYERASDLFYDEILEQPAEIWLNKNDFFKLTYKDGAFQGAMTLEGNPSLVVHGNYSNFGNVIVNRQYDRLSAFKYYKFAVQITFPRLDSAFLLPPSGANLMSLILAHKELRALIRDMFAPYGLEPNLRPQENKIEVIKRLEDITVSYPYSLVSDTLQRTVFHLMAIISNKDSVISLEEPESHAFPYYTKYLAETIALDDKKNQFFITTHNPYFLEPLLEKANKDEVAVFVTDFKDYQTRVRPLTPEELAEITEIDIFSNIDRYLESK